MTFRSSRAIAALLVAACGSPASAPRTVRPPVEEAPATTPDVPAPAVIAEARFIWLVGTEDAFCALDEERRAWCGVGSGPARLREELGAVDALNGSSRRFCARTGDRVWCWPPGRRPQPVEALDGAVAISVEGDGVCAALADGTVRCDGHMLFSSVTDAIDVALLHAGADPQICALGRDGRVRCEGCAYSWDQLELEAEVAVSRAHSGTRCTRAPVATRDRDVTALEWIASGVTRIVSPHGDRLGATDRVRDCRDAPCALEFEGRRRRWAPTDREDSLSSAVRVASGHYALRADGRIVYGGDGFTMLASPLLVSSVSTGTAQGSPVSDAPRGPVPFLVSVTGRAYVLQADGSVSMLDGSYRYVRVDVPPASEITEASSDAVAIRSGTQVWLLDRDVTERIDALEPAAALAGNGASLCAVHPDGTLSCMAIGNGRSCMRIGAELTDLETTYHGSCVLERGGRASCGSGHPCDMSQFSEVAQGIARLERRDVPRITLLDAQDQVAHVYDPRPRLPTYWAWCYGAPCACTVRATDFECGAPNSHPPSGEEITDVVMSIGRLALRADGSIARASYPSDDRPSRIIVEPPPR